MRSTTAPLLTLAGVVTVVLGFDLFASLATKFVHVAYVDFMIPDFVLFAGIGFALARWRSGAGTACFYVAIAAIVEATAGRALATALDAEGPPPGTTVAFLALETFAVAGFTMFWGAIGVALGAIFRRR